MQKLPRRLGDHLTAINYAVLIVAVAIIFYAPKGVHHIDVSTDERKSFVFGLGIEYAKVYKKQFSTNVQSMNGFADRDKWHGFPIVVISDPGLQKMEVYCSWWRLGHTLARWKGEIEVELEADTVYMLDSEYKTNRGIFNDECGVVARPLSQAEYQLIPHYQAEILRRFGVQI